MKKPERPNLVGAYVRAADGNVYRVSMRGLCDDPWGRVNGGPAVEIPRPFVVLRESEGIELYTKGVA